ncbi:GtrA family protein [Clostridium sp. CF012]|uniref:GtrA family protein n=1 Tax=Clostridium sp. CF012 TaxID=2843319 RepID=UPI001C0B61FB|nr:GtrA family protein [Clostridium sp. CF012]MBU3142780.1 GtrA family protein [Clostridium sp. CF012]
MGEKGLFDIKFLKFVLVGIINTIFGTGIMFLLYNLASFGYWGSSTVSYILGSILSFFLNKNFTFRNKESTVKTALRFTVNIAVCYLVAYSISKPIVTMILSNTSLSKSIVEQVSMLLGMVLFTTLNYVGQRFFAFKEK